jgi:hypothetical protein
VVAGYLTTLARATQNATDLIIRLCISVSDEISKSPGVGTIVQPEHVQVALVDLWVEMLDTAESFVSPLLDAAARRRLWICAALCLPGSTPQPPNTTQLPGMTTSLLSAVAQVANDSSTSDLAVGVGAVGDEDACKSDGVVRLRVLRRTDTALRCDVRAAFGGWTVRARQVVGDPILAQEFGQLDPVVRSVVDALLQ